MKIELSDEERRILVQALIRSQFNGKDSDVAVNLVYKLTHRENELDQ